MRLGSLISIAVLGAVFLGARSLDGQGVSNTISESTTSHTTTTVLPTVIVRQDQFQTRVTAHIGTNPNIYDQTFAAPFSDPTVQAAITAATTELKGAGAITILGPTLLSSQTTPVSSVTVNHDTVVSDVVTVKVTTYIGAGPSGSCIGILDRDVGPSVPCPPSACGAATPVSNDSPCFGTPLAIVAGGEDVDTLVHSEISVNRTPTETNTFLTQAHYDLIGSLTVQVTDVEMFLPVVLDNVAGVGGSHYTTELTLASKATTPIQVHLLYTASVGSGTGSVTLTLNAGETRIIPNTISFLRLQGLAIPTEGGVVGTLLATFVGGSSGDPFIGGRTFTSGDGGTFGLFYPASATATTSATLIGLQQNAAQRSNLALANASATSITLRVELFGPMGEDLGTLPDESLPAYGWTQINTPLLGKATSGRALVTEISGPTPFTAYGVLNDAVTSDGSFIPPLIANDSGPGDRLVPIVLDVHGLGGSHYTTELTLANLTSNTLPLSLAYTASIGSGSGQATLTLAPGEQQIVPDAITFLRLQGLSIPNDGSSVGGALLVKSPSGTPASSFAVGARTFTPAASGGGTFGLYYPGLTIGESATSVVYVNGLQQSSSQRSNLAVINRGDASDSISLNVSYFDSNGAALGTPTTVTLAPGQWTQFGQPLAALGAASGYARIEKTSGNSSFVAYGVLNDAVTSDGSYIPMSF